MVLDGNDSPPDRTVVLRGFSPNSFTTSITPIPMILNPKHHYRTLISTVTMPLRTTRIPLILAKRDRILFHKFHADFVLAQRIPTNVPSTWTQRPYATVPVVRSPVKMPAVQQKSEPRKGVMDYILTSADTVFHTEVSTDSIGCKLGSPRFSLAYDLWSCLLRCGDDPRINATL